MEEIWKKLYDYAKNKIYSKELSPYISYGNTVCTILSNNKIYCGVNINSHSHIKSSAEKNAIIEMLNNGESKIEKMLIINELEEIIKPCKECFDLINSLDLDYHNIEVLVNLKPLKVVTLDELLPDWWGTLRLDNNI